MINNDKIEIFNGIALLKDDQCICRFVRESGNLTHDMNLLPKLNEFIKSGDTVIDIGAFIGDHTVYYSNLVGESGEVHAFEPSIDALQCLVHNEQAFCEHGNTIVHQSALGAKNELKEIIKVDGNNGMNFISETALYAHRSSIERQTIEIDTIDNFMQNAQKVDFIKIDVEGFELDVLIGGKETINKFRPKMLIEINDMTLERQGVNRQQIFDWLTENNYIYRNIYKSQGLSDNQLDIICTPK